MADPGSDRAFQGWVDAGEQAANAVGDAGSFASQGDITDVNRAQRVEQSAGGVADDERWRRCSRSAGSSTVAGSRSSWPG
jgi:hypothetical protein